MAKTFDLILREGVVATPGVWCRRRRRPRRAYRRVRQLRRRRRGQSVDCAGLHVLPGVIDTQVHFREPGLEHKEDISTGTAAAAMGGVTAVFDMPNTEPPTVGAAELADKCPSRRGSRLGGHGVLRRRDAGECAADWPTWSGCRGARASRCSWAARPGSLLVADDAGVAEVLMRGSRRIAVHAEDETRLRERFTIVRGGADPTLHPEWRDVEAAYAATRRLLALAAEAKRRVHVLHVSTAEEMELLRRHRDLATVEVTPQHLTLAAPECYEELGSFAQMNPPIRDARHRQALWRALGDGLVDCIGSDHAPHTREEKKRPYPESPSGMPGVQTLVPVMLDHVARGRLSLERFVDLTSAGPARIYGIAGRGRIALGYSADFTVVDLKARRMITNRWIVSRCGWTPFDGMTVSGWPIATVVRGHVVMREGSLVNDPVGGLVRFLECP